MASVLVIDDNEEFREVVKDLLEDLGHQAHAAGCPEEGMKCCEESSIDLILCDLVMPVEQELLFEEESDSAMVGVHAIHELSSKYPNVPVIAVSGQMDGQPLRALRNFGAVDSLAKPFGRDELVRVVNDALERRAETVATV